MRCSVSSRALILTSLAGSLGFFGSASAQVIKDGRLIYPEGTVVPRSLSDVERQWLRTHPISGAGAFDAVTPPPVGPIHCAAEFEPQEGIIISWQGNSGLTGVQADMAKRVTVDAASKVYVVVANGTQQSSATSTLTSAGCDMSKVIFVTRTLDSIWMCDYGPRFIYEGNCRAVIDHKYNRPRPNDDIFPDYWGPTYKKQAFYQLGDGAGHQLIHGGGNFHLDGGNNRGFATRLTVNENNPPATAYSYPESTIVNTWLQYQGLTMTMLDPFPTSVDSTQHLDMWMQPVGNNTVIISDWPNNVGSTQDIICDNTAATLAAQGYTVFRVPAYSIGGVHYTFTNTVFVNNVLLVPSYTAGGGPATSSAAALATFQSALPPGKTAIAVNCQPIISLAGAIHCIVRILPAHKGLAGPNGGLAPTAYLQTPNGGQTLTPGQQFTISWVSDDDLLVSSVDLQLSTDGGATFPTTITTGQPAIGSFLWTVPSVNTAQARVRVIARDAVLNTGSDDSDANFTIGTPPVPCYANCDGSTTPPVLTANDFQCFLNLYASSNTVANCDNSTAAPVLTANDFQCFLNSYATGCP